MRLWWLLSLYACDSAPGPASPDSASAALAARAGSLGLRAAELAERAKHLGGRFDTLRAGGEQGREAEVAALREAARELVQEATDLEAEARAIGASAEVYRQ